MSSVTAVIDYGMGNLHSVQSALVKAGANNVVVTSDLALIGAASISLREPHDPKKMRARVRRALPCLQG